MKASERTELRNYTKPLDFEETSVFDKEPHGLKMHGNMTEEEQKLVATNKIFYSVKKVLKKPVKSLWDADISSTNPGYFDESGNFVLNGKPKKTFTSWLVKNGDLIEGPYTQKEIKCLIDDRSLLGKNIKRDFDRGFVEFNALVAAIPDFLYSKDLNRFFAENQAVEERQKDEFYDEVLVKEKNTKLGNFMRINHISANVDFIVKTIRGMRKIDAVRALGDITGLEEKGNNTLIDLIIEDMKVQILSDVDKDGFTINYNKRKAR